MPGFDDDRWFDAMRKRHRLTPDEETEIRCSVYAHGNPERRVDRYRAMTQALPGVLAGRDKLP